MEKSDKMPTLDATTEELLTLYPEEHENLSLVFATKRPNCLRMRYVLRAEEDEFRNWQTENSELDPIYIKSLGLIISHQLSKRDKILLHVDIKAGSDVAYLEFLQRHKAPTLKGIGESFYANLRDWLRKRKYKFVAITPLNDELTKYWERQGFVLIEDEKLRKYLEANGYATHVYFLNGK